jgi:hypothetical protein
MAKHKESRLGYILFCGIAIYVLMSLAIAMKTQDTACGGQQQNRHWSYLPPGWVCD